MNEIFLLFDISLKLIVIVFTPLFSLYIIVPIKLHNIYLILTLSIPDVLPLIKGSWISIIPNFSFKVSISIFFTLFIASSFKAFSCFSFNFLSISSLPNKLPSLSSSIDKSAWSIFSSDFLLFLSDDKSLSSSFFSFLSLFSSSSSPNNSSITFSSKFSIFFSEILILSDINKFPPLSP